MRPTVYLFDIDGTILDAGGAGRRSVEDAFGLHYGRRDACAGFSFAGMTDRAIVRRALGGLGLDEQAPDIEARIDALLETYLGLLAEEVRASARYRVHAGIVEALDALDAAPAGFARAVGLGTGNVERGARIKLGRLGLADRFAFGGFGSDAEDRAELLAVGAERGAALLGLARAACRVVVIGDTPRDIHAAHAISAAAIGVATGPFSVEELRAAGADFAFADLCEAGALPAVLGA